MLGENCVCWIISNLNAVRSAIENDVTPYETIIFHWKFVFVWIECCVDLLPMQAEAGERETEDESEQENEAGEIGNSATLEALAEC